MARTERSWNTDFQAYMDMIVNHPNYIGLPIERKRDGSLSWIATAQSKIGKARKQWAEDKAQELGFIIQPGVYAQVMREIHPSKEHVCQICGSRMSIYYHYPSVNFLKTIKREFALEFTEYDHISDIWEQLLNSGVSDDKIRVFLKRKFEIQDITGKSKDDIIAVCERKCRENGKKLLSPGAMSNFPDRYDGFHTYNRCCRASQDTGRSAENLKSYTKDRRAYEYWSDGNIHAADMFMGSSFFKGRSADHIGPISLGFVHDPHYLRPMTSSDNSTKRDHLLVEDIDTILSIEAETKVSAMSWYSVKIWKFIKENFKMYPHRVDSFYRNMLKQNMANFMFILSSIINIPDKCGRNFLIKEFIEPKYKKFFLHTYEFDEYGNIISSTPRRFTERSNNEIERFARIAFDAVNDYDKKSNRHLFPDLTPQEIANVKELCKNISTGGQVGSLSCHEQMKDLVRLIENRLILAEIITKLNL